MFQNRQHTASTIHSFTFLYAVKFRLFETADVSFSKILNTSTCEIILPVVFPSGAIFRVFILMDVDLNKDIF